MIMMNNPRHSNRLVPSKQDDVQLAYAVEQNFLKLCDSYLTITGSMLEIPPSLYVDVKRWRQMRVRHKGGDLRNTEAESKAVKTIAQWTVDINHALCHQKSSPAIEWDK